MALLYPPRCPFCEGPLPENAVEPELCEACVRKIDDVRPACFRCARPLPTGQEPRDDACCARCQRKRPRLQRAIALGVYRDDLKELVLRIKQPGNEPLAFVAGRLLAERYRQRPSDTAVDLLLPMPVHWSRRLFRGFNCPELLAESMSRWLMVPMASRLVVCARKTKKQGTLMPTERLRNVRGAYRLTRRKRVAGKHVMIVDDVMTTGATANEMARVLRKAGASGITLAVIARGIGFGGQ